MHFCVEIILSLFSLKKSSLLTIHVLQSCCFVLAVKLLLVHCYFYHLRWCIIYLIIICFCFCCFTRPWYTVISVICCAPLTCFCFGSVNIMLSIDIVPYSCPVFVISVFFCSPTSSRFILPFSSTCNGFP